MHAAPRKLHLMRNAALSFITSVLLATSAHADDPIAHIEVLPGWTTRTGTYMTGIRINLQDGWKTYWRAPGDAGIPPLFSWAGSENFDSVSIHWPTPDVFDSNGMQTIGYHDSVVIPLELGATGGQVHLKGEVELGVCDDICMPVQLSFDALLPDGKRPTPAIAGALMDRPMPAQRANVGQVTCEAEPSADGITVTAHIPMPSAGSEEVVVMEAADPQLWVSETESWREGQTLVAEADIVAPRGQPIALDRSRLRFTVLGSDRAVDIKGCAGVGG